MSTTQFIQQWFEEIWNNNNESFIDQMMDKDVVVHGLDPTGTMKGTASFKDFYKNFRKTFPVIHVKVQSLVSDNEFVTGYCMVSATSAEGKDVSFSGISVKKIKNDKLIESWNCFDFLKMYQQLGHILMAQIPD